ncbi:MAG: flagellar basal body P-ring formation chaperone FlgA [Syntrophales bacterium]|nr:flagellar basal body P-ring formation chaperone FlgA [Syntrophales bacterium]
MKRFIYLIIFLAGLTMMAGPVMGAASASSANRTYNLGELVNQYVRENSSRSAEDIRMEFPEKLPEVSLKGEKISHEVSQMGKTVLIGNCHFLVRFFDNGVQIAKYTLRADIEVRENYITAVRVIKRNSIVGTDDLQIAERWVRRISLKAISDVDEVVGNRLIVDLAPDREILRGMVKEPVLIKKGEVVRIVLDNGRMSLMATGVAEEPGVDRQRIRVKNLSSQKTILAKVMAEGLVKVEFF